ncbi:MAG: hypothetical protein M9894_21125 [Planctomycetes bacterium]|nr:hypothetical protein [Planctomycetota bacterium]
MTRRPHDVLLLGRGVLAGAMTEALLGLGLLGLGRALDGDWAHVPGVLLAALAAGLAGGFAWGAAEAAARRARRTVLLVGLAVGAPLALTVPLASEYTLHLRAASDSLTALEALRTHLPSGPALVWVVSAALCLHLPLLTARRRGPDIAREALAMSVGLVVWLGAVVLAGGGGGLNASLLLAALVPRVVVFPLALRAADALCTRAARLAHGEPARARVPARRAPTPLERHRARWHEERGRALLARGEASGAVSDLARSHALWPDAERALLLAEAHARAGAVAPAVDALVEAADLAGGRPRGWDPADPVWSPVRGHAAVEALAARPASGARRAGRSPAARLALVAWALTLTTASAAPSLVAPDEPASATRLRLLAWLTGDAARWRALAEALEEAPEGAPTGWLPLDLASVGPRREPGPERVLRAYLRAAEAGDAGSMLRAADRLACYPGRAPDAVRWLRRAAEAGEPTAMWRLGTILRDGSHGAARDVEEGRRWWARAAAAGVAEARAELTRWGEGGAVDEAAANGVDAEAGR